MIPDYLYSACYQNICVERLYVIGITIPLIIVIALFVFRDFLKFKSKEEKEMFKKRKKGLRWFVFVTRVLITFFLLAALTLPFTTEQVTNTGAPVIKLVIDSTDSMNIFDDDIISQVKSSLGTKVPIEISQMSSARNSELGEGILRNIGGEDNLLLITDGNNNVGKRLIDVGFFAQVADTRLFALNIEPDKNDAYVEVLGPSDTIKGTSNRFTVKVSHVGAQPTFTLQIFVDDQLEFSGQNIFEKEILKTFTTGHHKITAKIILDDLFSENNEFHKTVKTVPKPKILFVSQRSSPLEEGLKGIYDLTSRTSIPQSLTRYDAIVLNDIPYNSIQNNIDGLTGVLLNGGGIVVLGGTSSFDRGNYEDTLFEAMLPVKAGAGKIIQPVDHNIVITLDVSESFSDFSFKEGGQETALDLGKGMAVKMIEGFRDDIKVGVVAFASLGQIISEPVELKDNREVLISKIKRIGKGQGTSIDQGLLAAEHALSDVKGTKNVILISDGKMGHFKEPPAPKLVAERMADKGVKIFTVGLPSELYDIDINRQLMTKLAAIGGGNYFEPTEFQFLHVFFGTPEEKDQIFSGSSNVAVLDREHFITNNLRLDARVTGVNFVVPKKGARSLIFTGDGNPLLNTWNFGVGRVVTLATDDGSQWAASLVERKNSLLLTRMINYAVGNPEKGKELYVDAADGFLGEGVEIEVVSEKFPTSSELTFTREGDSLYRSTFSPEAAGYYQFFEEVIAVNAPREYYSLGLNQELTQMVELTGGKMLDPEEDFAEDIESNSVRVETKRKDLKLFPLAIALMIFIVEIIVRKLKVRG